MSFTTTSSSIDAIKEVWFDEFIAAIKTHQIQLATNTATEEIKKLYEVFMSGNDNELAELNKITANKHFIKKVIVAYLKEVTGNMPIKLAFDMDDSEVLVWAEIEDDNEAAEDFLLMAEAKVNAIYHQYGYDLTSTIVEVRDKQTVPNHYAVFKG